MRRYLALLVLATVGLVEFSSRPILHGQNHIMNIAPASPEAIRDWDSTVHKMMRSDELRVRIQRADTLIKGRSVEWIGQYYNGVRVWGGEVNRQIDEAGVTVSLFGLIYADISVDTIPVVSAD